MKKIISSILGCVLLATVLPASAQFLVVADGDGFVNVWVKATAKSAITDTLPNGYLPYYYDAPAGNWLGIDYEKRGKAKSGFIYSNRTSPVDSFEVIPMLPVNKNAV